MADIKKTNTEDIRSAVREKQEAMRVFRFGGSGSRTRNVREGRSLRRDVARHLTELRAREIDVEIAQNGKNA